MRTDTGETVRLEDYAPTLYAAPTTTLMFALHPTRTIVRNETRYEPRGAGARGAPLELVGDDLTLLDALVDGTRLRLSEFESTPDSFVLTGIEIHMLSSVAPKLRNALAERRVGCR